MPPLDSNLVRHYENGTTVAFGDDVFYTCQTDHFFDEDYDMHNFSLKCNTTGEFDNPEPWKKCIHFKGKCRHNAITNVFNE